MDNKTIQMIESIKNDVRSKTVTVCGKMKYEDKIRTIAAKLEVDNGWNMLIPIGVEDKLNIKINDDKMDTLRYIHFNKIYKSDAILVYVDKDNTFIDSYNIMNEILAALTYEKEIMFTQLLNVATIQKLTGHVNYVMGGFGKRFKVIRFNTITYNDFTYYTLDYAVLREEE